MLRERKRKKKAAQAKAAAELAAAMEAAARAEEEERLRAEEKKRLLRERGRAVIEQQRLARKQAAEEQTRLRLERRLAVMEREDAVASVTEYANEKRKLSALATRVAQLENEIQAEEHEIEQLTLPPIDMRAAAQVQSARTPRSKFAPAESRGWVTNRSPKEVTDPETKAANDMARSRRLTIKQNDDRLRQNNRELWLKKRELLRQRAAAQQRAATKLQCVFRGFKVRIKNTRAAEISREQNKAATLLEANWRGASTRRRLQRERRAAGAEALAVFDAVSSLSASSLCRCLSLSLSDSLSLCRSRRGGCCDWLSLAQLVPTAAALPAAADTVRDSTKAAAVGEPRAGCFPDSGDVPWAPSAQRAGIP